MNQSKSSIAQIAQLRNQDIRERQLLIDAIEVLNDSGLVIVEIDGTLYATTEFVRPDDGIYDIELIGRNITTVISNQLNTQGFSQQALLSLLQTIEVIPERRRRFHRDSLWKEYLPKGAM